MVSFLMSVQLPGCRGDAPCWQEVSPAACRALTSVQLFTFHFLFAVTRDEEPPTANCHFLPPPPPGSRFSSAAVTLLASLSSPHPPHLPTHCSGKELLLPQPPAHLQQVEMQLNGVSTCCCSRPAPCFLFHSFYDGFFPPPYTHTHTDSECSDH